MKRLIVFLVFIFICVVGYSQTFTPKQGWEDRPAIIDESTTDTIYMAYVGRAQVPPSDYYVKCSILRITTSSNIITYKWAEGSIQRNKTWGLRATYTYKFLQ